MSNSSGSSPSVSNPEREIWEICENLAKFLVIKNNAYGNSHEKPLRIFSKADSGEGVLVRLDDKLSRISNSSVLRKNDVVDLMGYLVLLCRAEGWDSFEELLD